MDYALPIASDIPAMEIVHQRSPSPLNPLGVKGVGEGGAVAPPAAIANAVCDALAPFGIEINRTPLRPAEIVAATRSRQQGRTRRCTFSQEVRDVVLRLPAISRRRPRPLPPSPP